MIFHQAENYTQDIPWKTPSDWLVYNTPSGYIDRDFWMKAISLFSRTCWASKINPQVLFFDVHDRHFNDRDTHLLRYHHIYPFILKAGDSTNDQPNDNGAQPEAEEILRHSKSEMAETAWNRQIYSFPHEFCSCGYVAFVSTKIILCHSWCLKKNRSSCPLPHLITKPTPRHV